ncbi:PR domain zinc finger protein 5 [Folsomia candida]|uniref:PR domain zinc finger protein 5 n=1 Tax=Folsomia candida TaxID=158441 RepID=UPI000B9040E2|nr:PR domain zinc finger protein 5 [Folsomia candida]
MEVNDTQPKFFILLNALAPTTEKMDSGESFEENGPLPAEETHSIQPQPTPADDNHVQSPSAKGRASKAKKLPQVGEKGAESGRREMEKIFPCKICLCPFTNRTSARRHAHTHLNCSELEQKKIFHVTCPHCQKVFTQRRYFIDHVKALEGLKDFGCPACKMTFTHKASLNRHLFVHLSPEEQAEAKQSWRHECHFCSKRFRFPSFLARHLLKHTEEKGKVRKDIECLHCRQSFTSKWYLGKHLKKDHPSEQSLSNSVPSNDDIVSIIYISVIS